MRIEEAEKLRIDMEVIAAEEAVRKIIKALKYHMDPLIRNVYTQEGEEAIEFEDWVKRRAQNQKYIDKLQAGTKPSTFSRS